MEEEKEEFKVNVEVNMETMQEKNDEIDILTSQLHKEKEKLRLYEKQFADLNEEYTLQTAKYN